MTAAIDVTFDVRQDTPPGKDPDAWSPTLRNYHKLVWGRNLPNGDAFDLNDSGPIRSRYLVYSPAQGDLLLSSDSVIPTYTRWIRMQRIISQFSEEENDTFLAIGYTIGGMMIWPQASTGGGRSINVERGFNQKIADRMDLTLECVRRHYLGQSSPMAPVLEANHDFFSIFGDFEGFVQHFLLQDLLAQDGRTIDFFLPFDDFNGRATPGDVDSYRRYRDKSIAFIHARNQRILKVAQRLGASEVTAS